MSSEIILGGLQACERPLGYDVQNTWGGWSGTYTAFFVNLFNHTITIKNPNGAYALGQTSFTSYCSGISNVQGMVETNSQIVHGVSWGKMYYAYASYHERFTYVWYSDFLTPGTHSFQAGIFVSSGSSITFDSNDGGTSSLWEVP